MEDDVVAAFADEEPIYWARGFNLLLLGLELFAFGIRRCVTSLSRVSA